MKYDRNPLPVICERCDELLKQDLDHYLDCTRIMGSQHLESLQHDFGGFYGSFMEALMNSDAVFEYSLNRPSEFLKLLSQTYLKIEDAVNKLDQGKAPRDVDFHRLPYKAQVQAVSIGLGLKRLQLGLSDDQVKWVFKISRVGEPIIHISLNDYLDATPLPRR